MKIINAQCIIDLEYTINTILFLGSNVVTWVTTLEGLTNGKTF